ARRPRREVDAVRGRQLERELALGLGARAERIGANDRRPGKIREAKPSPRNRRQRRRHVLELERTNRARLEIDDANAMVVRIRDEHGLAVRREREARWLAELRLPRRAVAKARFPGANPRFDRPRLGVDELEAVVVRVRDENAPFRLEPEDAERMLELGRVARAV